MAIKLIQIILTCNWDLYLVFVSRNFSWWESFILSFKKLDVLLVCLALEQFISAWKMQNSVKMVVVPNFNGSQLQLCIESFPANTYQHSSRGGQDLITDWLISSLRMFGSFVLAWLVSLSSFCLIFIWQIRIILKKCCTNNKMQWKWTTLAPN